MRTSKSSHGEPVKEIAENLDTSTDFIGYSFDFFISFSNDGLDTGMPVWTYWNTGKQE